MASNFPYLYRNSPKEAERLGETRRYEDSLNVQCARVIEQAIRVFFSEEDKSLRDGCALSVLERYGFKRVNLVLANSLAEMGCKHFISDETRQWGRTIFVPQDGKYNRYFAVDTAAALLESFVTQTRQAYHALDLFGPEHCVGEAQEQDSARC